MFTYILKLYTYFITLARTVCYQNIPQYDCVCANIAAQCYYAAVDEWDTYLLKKPKY